MKSQLGNGYVILFGLLLAAAGLFGWVWNIVKIIGSCCDPLTGMLVMRIIGVFVAPLGAVLGYF